MDTNVTARLVPCNPMPANDPSKYLILVLVFLALAFIVGLLIILLSRKTNKISERPPVFGAEAENENETSQNVDMSVPGAEDLTLTQEDVSVQPVPHLGHPDDEGVPVPKYDEEAKTLVVDTDVAPVDVNADVPVAPVPAEADEADSAVFVWHTPETTPTTEDTTMDTTTPEPTPENLDAAMPEETAPEAVAPEPATPEMEASETENVTADADEAEAAMPEPETAMPGAEDVAAENDAPETVMPEPENVNDMPTNPLDSLKAKFEELKDKTVEFLEGEGEDAPLERIKRAALEAKDKAEEKAVELKEKAHEIATSEQAQEIRSTLEAKAEEAKEKAVELWEKAKASAEDENSFLGQAKRAATDVKEKAEDYFSNKTNPRDGTAENTE